MRPLGFGEAGQAPHDGIVDEGRHVLVREAGRRVRVEHFEEIFEIVRQGVGAEGGERLQRGDVGVSHVVEGERIEAEIGQSDAAAGLRRRRAVAHKGQRGGAEPARRRLVVLGAAMAPDVGRVIGADRRLDARADEGAAIDQRLDVGGRRQQDVDHVLFDDVGALREEFGAGAQAGRRAVGRADRADRVEAGAHVGVLGVGDDEIAAAIVSGADARELVVESRHGVSCLWVCGRSNAERGRAQRGALRDEVTRRVHALVQHADYINQARRRGSAQLATVAETPIMRAGLGGQPVVMVATMEASDNDVQLLTRVEGGIKSIADLKGKKIATAIGTSAEYMVIVALASKGLKPSDATIINLRPQDMPTALERGDVDAYAIWQPHTYNGLKLLEGKAAYLDTKGIYVETFNIVGMRDLC